MLERPHLEGFSTSPRATALRLGAALGMFLLLLSGGAWWMLARPRGPAPASADTSKTKPNKASASESPVEDGFFYAAIGALPEDQPREAEGQSTPKASGAPKASYTLEIMMTQDRAEAETLIESLRDAGIEAYYTPLSRAGHVVYRVRRGIFPSRREADDAALAFRQAAARDAKVVKLQ